MGYYTRYTLEWDVPPDHKGEPRCKHAPKSGNFCPECATPVGVAMPDELITAYIAENEYFIHALGPDGDSGDSCKWYDHQTDMRIMSKRFRGVLFTLSGEGEEHPDIWKRYFLNGKMQEAKARIEFDEFDKAKLE